MDPGISAAVGKSQFRDIQRYSGIFVAAGPGCTDDTFKLKADTAPWYGPWARDFSVKAEREEREYWTTRQRC